MCRPDKILARDSLAPAAIKNTADQRPAGGPRGGSGAAVRAAICGGGGGGGGGRRRGGGGGGGGGGAGVGGQPPGRRGAHLDAQRAIGLVAGLGHGAAIGVRAQFDDARAGADQ